MSLILGAGIFTIKYPGTQSASNMAVQVEDNRLYRGSWKMEITDIKFKVGNSPTQKTAEAFNTLESTAGGNTPMLPKGKIISIVGSSGKTYNTPANDPKSEMNYSLNVMFESTESNRKEFAKKQGKAFEQGVFLLAHDVVVDMTEETISKVIYEDENGNIVDIPIVGINPITVKLSEGK